MRYTLILLFAGFIFLGCTEKKGPMERAGERVDEITDNVREGEPPFKKKGTMERAGEAIDDALQTNKRDH